MNSKILVATHKQYHFPHHAIYTPIHVGKALTSNEFGYLSDNTGQHMSDKNRHFCELTALYWAWKNHFFSNYQYVGMVHYRRYFSGKLPFKNFSILSEKEIIEYMRDHDMILPQKRNYYIETVKSHYAHAHNLSDLLQTREIIAQKHSSYLPAFDTLMQQKKLYLYNMFVMKEEAFSHYMNWLFDILFTLESHIDVSSYDIYQRRVFGFLSERLFNVWIIHHQPRIKEVKVINLEGENKPFKAWKMIKRKFLQKDIKN